MTPNSSQGRLNTFLLGAVLVTAFNLRVGTASVGPVLRDLQISLAMSDSVAGLLVALPPLCFGVVGLLSGPLSRRFDAERLLVAFSVLLAAGLIVRVLTGSLAVFMLASLGSIVGISVVNIMVPVVIRRWFPERVAKLSGTYTMILTYGAFFGAAFTVPVGQFFGGWRGGLGLWAIPAVIGPVLVTVGRRWRAAGDALISGRRPVPAGGSDVRLGLFRNPKAWALTMLLGIQGFEAFSILGWFAAILRDDGVSAVSSGWLLSITMLVSAPLSALLPRLTARNPDQRVLITGFVISSGCGYGLLLMSPSRFALPAMVLLGIGMTTFSLALLLIGLRAPTARGTAALASMVQGAGFLFAGIGPLLFGWLFERTGSWQAPLWALVILLIPKVYAGTIVGRPGLIFVDPEDGEPGPEPPTDDVVPTQPSF
jgi:CP family cyanate transporter-like MFS transporter